MSEAEPKPYADPDHPSNKIRPDVQCKGCGLFGCVGEYWGPWCFKCNNERIERITRNLEAMVTKTGVK